MVLGSLEKIDLLKIGEFLLNILLSNDDGVTAPGIQTLAAVLREFYHVQVIAPDRNRSGLQCADAR